MHTAMILAAGRGERMRPLTDHLPKPLLEAGGKPLIVWHLERIKKAGFSKVVINHAWLGNKIEQALGDGSQWGLSITFSPETQALETAGGIAKAMPLLDEYFFVVNGDIYSDFAFERAHSMKSQLEQGKQKAYCVMVPNAPHHPGGDFAVQTGLMVRPAKGQGLTFSGLAVYHRSFFDGLNGQEKVPLRPLFEAGVDKTSIAAEVHHGQWFDIGTPERLAELDQRLSREALRQVK